MSLADSAFFNILKQFNDEVIQNKAEYQEEVSLEKDIEFKEICWGAFVL
jgi:hypothetical protein